MKDNENVKEGSAMLICLKDAMKLMLHVSSKVSKNKTKTNHSRICKILLLIKSTQRMKPNYLTIGDKQKSMISENKMKYSN